jgi:signal transduction histidine kinase
MVFELNIEYLRGTILPAVLTTHLGDSGRLDYSTKIAVNGDPSVVIYQSNTEDTKPFAADATVGLLDVNPGPPVPGDGRGRGPGPRPKGPKGPGPPPVGTSAWLLSVQHRAGSLEALAATTRRRNMGISAGILLLILTTAAGLLRVSRETQRVAELQMNFVAGVSHELRTPLTVIRTAAFNLRKTFASNPEQVERYGELIQKESEKLGDLVEQVLRYGSAKAGAVTQQTEAVEVERLIESSLRASRISAAGADLVLEKKIDPGLPSIVGDEEALQHALQNLFDNAVKHGAKGRWIGIFATAGAGSLPVIEIRVADHGPGIPPHELAHIFDPFFRGRRALEDQVHGTGLGLNLVKRIVEAHRGSIDVKSEPMTGTEFIVRIPAGSRKAATT